MRCSVRTGMQWGQVDARSSGWVSDPLWPIDEDPSSLDPLGTGGVDTCIVEIDLSWVPVLQQIFLNATLFSNKLLDPQYLEHGFIISCTMRPDVAAGDGQCFRKENLKCQPEHGTFENCSSYIGTTKAFIKCYNIISYRSFSLYIYTYTPLRKACRWLHAWSDQLSYQLFGLEPWAFLQLWDRVPLSVLPHIGPDL